MANREQLFQPQFLVVKIVKGNPGYSFGNTILRVDTDQEISTRRIGE
jgi:hypothetical protein